MIFGVAELISFCSHSFTLEPGDVILTGTPWGCGEFMDPKRRSRTATSSSARSRGSGCCATRWSRYEGPCSRSPSTRPSACSAQGVADRRRHARRCRASRPTESHRQPAPRRPGRHRARRRHGARSARRRRSPQVGARGRVPARRDRVDRLADDPQPGDRRRQPVRAPAARRPRGLPARARRARVDHRRDGARESACSSDGLVTASASRSPSAGSTRRRCGASRTRASIVTVASDGVRIALGGVAPRAGARAPPPRRRSPQGDIEAAAEPSVEAADPFDDAYASAWYRRRVLPVHVRRALSHAV